LFLVNSLCTVFIGLLLTRGIGLIALTRDGESGAGWRITQWYSAFLVVGDIPRARGRLPHLPGLPMSFAPRQYQIDPLALQSPGKFENRLLGPTNSLFSLARKQFEPPSVRFGPYN